MKYYQYAIAEDELKKEIGEVKSVPEGYIEYQPDGVYYKIVDGKITDVIGAANDEEGARTEVENFLSGLNVNLF